MPPSAIGSPRKTGGGPQSLGRAALERAFWSRVEREHADEDLLDRHRADPALAPSILAIHPAPDSPVPSRLERDIGIIRQALEAGRVAAHEALAA